MRPALSARGLFVVIITLLAALGMARAELGAPEEGRGQVAHDWDCFKGEVRQVKKFVGPGWRRSSTRLRLAE